MRYVKMYDELTVYSVDGRTPMRTKSDNKVMTIGSAQYILERTVDPQWGSTFESLRSSKRIRDAVLKVTVDEDYLALEEEDWRRLCSSVKSPSQSINVLVALAAFPIMESILEAPEQPRPEKG